LTPISGIPAILAGVAIAALVATTPAGVRIAVITGRPASQRAATISCLRERGYPNWDALITRTTATSARFKAQAR
jgi:hypothetical protein